jgi:hypothetical protein
MSETPLSPRSPVPTSQLRPLAVRLSDDLRAQLDLIAQLRDRGVTEEIRVALESWVDQAKSDPKLQATADEARRQIEAEADRRRGAITAIFDESKVATATEPRPGARAPRSTGDLKAEA